MRSTSSRAALALALALTALGAPTTAPAQPDGDPPPAAPPSGALRVLVFVTTRPVAGVTVETAAAPAALTNADGAAALRLPEGAHAVRLRLPRAALPAAPPGADPVVIELGELEVIGDEEVEAIVTLGPGGALARLDVETPTSRAEARQRDVDFERRRREEPPGVIRGTVTVRDTRAPVAGARVYVRGAPVEGATDDAGGFQLELPAGRYDLTIIHPRFTTVSQKDVAADPARPTVLALVVDPVTAVLDDLVVTAPHIEGGLAALVAERRESASVDEVIGAQEMSRSGDGDAAGALKRVTGITVIGGRYVYVRGMGERYSSTLLNGQAIPSPEPERRVIPLDLFSTDVLESVVIQKTPSPDAPGEFGGGVVQLRTKGFPDALELSASVSTGLLSTATFQARPTYRGGARDWLGMDDGTRALPGPIRAGSPLREGNLFEPGYTREELADLARLLPATYNVDDASLPPNLGLGLAAGNSYRVRGMRAGFLLSTSYSNEQEFTEEISRRYVVSDTAAGGLELNNDFRVRDAGHTISSSTILVAGVQPAAGHDVRATTLLLRITDDETGISTGRSDDFGRDIQQFRLQWVERQLLTQQLAGEHLLRGLGGGTASWRYAFSRATRAEPDRREYFYSDEALTPGVDPHDFQISARPAGNQRIWSDLDDRIHDLGFDLGQPLTVWGGREATVKLGASMLARERRADTIRLTLRAPRMLTAEERRQRPDDLWAEENLSADTGWILEDTTQPTDAYSAEQGLQAGYVMATVPLRASVELTGGVRVERSRQRVVTFSPFSLTETPLVAELDDLDVLPSLAARWTLSEALILRGSLGRSVTRPDFRELSRSQYRDVITATRFTGNPALVRGTIAHADLRAEYYFSTDEVVSLAAFVKSFADPIEQIDLGGVDRTVSWDNAESATNAGLELDGRRRLDLLGERFENFFVAGNLAVIRSQVDLGEDGAGVSTSRQRALQGQSPYALNLQVGYDDPGPRRFSAVALYNVAGPRIRDVGRLGTPDVFEEPVHQLDLVYGQALGGGLRLKLKAANLLDQAVTFTQADRVVRQYKRGRAFGVSLSWSYD